MSSWIKCICGNLVHTNLFCGANVYRLISDVEYDALPEAAGAEDFGRLFTRGREVVRCSVCRRLIVRWERGSSPQFYREEDSPEV